MNYSRLLYNLKIVKKIVFVQVAGGLGNQLFSWAMAHKLAQSEKNRIILLTNYDKNENRKCEIKKLNKNCGHGVKVWNLPGILNVFVIYDFLLSKIKFKSVRNFLSNYFYSSSQPTEVPQEKQLENKIFLRGFFQNSRMVEDVRHSINKEVIEFASKLFSKESFIDVPQIVHVRRGDLKENKDTIGVLTDEYFSDLLNEDSYSIVTDEIVNGTSELWQSCQTVYLGETSPWLVIWLGMNSQVFIGSNSTLSWWAAYLNEQDGARLYLPKPWTVKGNDEYSLLYLNKVCYVESRFGQS